MALTAELRERAEQRGRQWALSLSADMLREARSLEGGFPGTISEARMHALSTCAPDELPDPVRAEFQRVLYDAARAHWVAGCRSR